MTREVAIDVLEKMKYPQKVNKNGFVISNVDIENEALDMAIQALSQEPICDRDCEHCTWTECPIEPCDDAISREAVKDILNNSYSLTDAEHKVEQLPPVTQKSETVTEFADRCRECGKMRKGHWIYDKTIENWWCSKCNKTPKTMGYVGTADFMAEHFKFCNHCGAKMESEVQTDAT